MRIRIQYDDQYQTLDIPDEEAARFYVSLTGDGDGLGDATREEARECVQEAVDEAFNRPEYNNWHTMRRHTQPLPEPGGDGEGGITPGMEDIPDPTDVAEQAAEDDEWARVLGFVRSTLPAEQADAFIHVLLLGEDTRSYAGSRGISCAAARQRVSRARRRLRDARGESHNRPSRGL